MNKTYDINELSKEINDCVEKIKMYAKSYLNCGNMYIELAAKNEVNNLNMIIKEKTDLIERLKIQEQLKTNLSEAATYRKLIEKTENLPNTPSKQQNIDYFYSRLADIKEENAQLRDRLHKIKFPENDSMSF